MPISFNSIQDPFGLASAGSLLAQALQNNSLQQKQNDFAIQNQERQNQFLMNREGRQNQALQQQQSVLASALQAVDGDLTDQQNQMKFISTLALNGGPVDFGLAYIKNVNANANNMLKSENRTDESKAALDFLRKTGQPVPDYQEGEPLPPASFLSSLFQKPVYEPESDKIEAKRSADFADTVVKEFQGAEASKVRLAQMETAANSGNLPTPTMVKTMDVLGIPIGVLGNPLAEAYEKNVNEYIKDVSNYFPGQIRVAEIEPYMKTIPTLLNSDDGKKIIIRNQQLINRAKESTYQAYKDILKENNGRKPRNLDVEILERTSGLRDQLSEELKENFQEAVSITRFPTAKVKQGTRISPTTALNYLNKAGGDRVKAQEMAKKDGYEF